MIKYSENDFAIIGMSCRFPGANNINEYWSNLLGGRETVTFFSDDEIKQYISDPDILQDPKLVKAKPMIDDYDKFDYRFFDYSPGEAKLVDPQSRLMLQCAWETLEIAGYDPERYTGKIGVYAGCQPLGYFMSNVHSNFKNQFERSDAYTRNFPDYLATIIAYKFNLRGPAVSSQSFCSTSLINLHFATQSIKNGDCDMALAGAVNVHAPEVGYLSEDGGVESKDGHCRVFAKDANGTVFGDGYGMVLIKRAQQAVDDKDHIYAIIKSTALNNDGSDKLSYYSPSITAQQELVETAIRKSGVPAESISYVEAHGTATEIGDRIEVTALTNAYRSFTHENQFCAIGSVKSNIGHMGIASGMAGLIKTLLCLVNKKISPTLWCENPNSKLRFEKSPFYVNNKLQDWKTGKYPRRAGVSSFGFGGTNGHVILEEAPEHVPSEKKTKPPYLVFQFSAKTDIALDQIQNNIKHYIQNNTSQTLEDIVYTLSIGRKQQNNRRILICQNDENVVSAFENEKTIQATIDPEELVDAQTVFMFPGQGAQYINMGKELYLSQLYFKEKVDECNAIIQKFAGFSLLEIIFDESNDPEKNSYQLKQTHVTQPAIFTISYALAKLWIKWGVVPNALIGHSVGEYVAACISGVLTLEEALFIVTSRGKSLQSLAGGDMLAVPLPLEDVKRYLNSGVSIAAINTPSLIIVSGEKESVQNLRNKLEADGHTSQYLHTSHAFHSYMMDPVLDNFKALFSKVNLKKPTIPILSTVTADWLSDDQAMNPDYWVKNLRGCVNFSGGITNLIKTNTKSFFIEVGPGQTLSALTRLHLQRGQTHDVISSFPHVKDQSSEYATNLKALGTYWTKGGKVDWNSFYDDSALRRIPLPTYPFEKSKVWMNPAKSLPLARAIKNQEDWFYVPSWKRAAKDATPINIKDKICLVFTTANEFSRNLIHSLKKGTEKLIEVQTGDAYAVVSPTKIILRRNEKDDYETLFKYLKENNAVPDNIVHLWNTEASATTSINVRITDSYTNAFFSILYIAQSIGNLSIERNICIDIISNNAHLVVGNDSFFPERAIITGPVKTIPVEYPNLFCRHIDVDLSGTAQYSDYSEVAAAIFSNVKDQFIAFRGKFKWVQVYEQQRIVDQKKPPVIKKNGTYLITGGVGGIGLVFARYLMENYKANVVLTSRSAFPPRADWEDDAVVNKNDKLSKRIKDITQTEKSTGTRVDVMQIDVGDLGQVTESITKIRQKYTGLDGIIHMAGNPGGGIIQTKDEKIVLNVFNPKITGLLNIIEATKELELDFILMGSSMGAIVNEGGQVDYCSANAFLDSMANHYSDIGRHRLIAVNWPMWGETGMGVETNVPEAMRKQREKELKEGLTNKEGAEAFDNILKSGLTQVIVSKKEDVNTMIAQALCKSDEPEKNDDEFAPRPEISTTYEKPENEIQEKIVSIWSKLIGIEDIGIHDDFSELGGHSLMAVQVIKSLKTEFPKVELNLEFFRKSHTVKSIADRVEKVYGEVNEMAV